MYEIFTHELQLTFCIIFGIINLYAIVKYKIEVKRVYPLSASKSSKHNDIVSKEITSSLFKA